ncbi:MAG TPA: hypothetical protein VHC41_00125 [Mycobacteriales bacterium]|nr:hypothetical protein [Mycobacteriales bacterium]
MVDRGPRWLRHPELLVPVLCAALLLAITLRWSLSPGWRRHEEHDRLVRLLRSWPHPEHSRLLHALTFFGQWWLLVLVAMVSAGILVAAGARYRALLFAASAAVVLAAVLAGKLTLVHSSAIHSFGLRLGGFPSGHTADSTVLFGVGVLAWSPRRAAWAGLGVGAVAGAAVGWSRYALGLHTTAEVAGGWLLGMLVLSLATVCVVRTETGRTPPTSEPDAQQRVDQVPYQARRTGVPPSVAGSLVNPAVDRP